MNTDELIVALDSALNDDFVCEALRTIFAQEQIDGYVPVELDGEVVPIPLNVSLELVTKSFFKEYLSDAFPTGYRAQIAIGGVSTTRPDLRARYCFATLFFNEQREMFTVDFHVLAR